MSIHIRYAYLHGQVWMFRRNYPEDVRLVLGSQALKRSLKTSDPKLAKARAAELSAVYDTQLVQVRQGYGGLLAGAQSGPQGIKTPDAWGGSSKRVLAHLRATLATAGPDFGAAKQGKRQATVAALAKVYLRKRSGELRLGGFKSVRYSVGLFADKYAGHPITLLDRENGREFLGLVSQLSAAIGKSERTRRLRFDQLVAFSRGRRDLITARTQRRIWAQVNHFLDWAVYEGQLEQNPFRKVRFEQKVRPAPYAVPTDLEVQQLLGAEDRDIHQLLLFCLLTGMRSGEAAGLLREDLIQKHNLGWFALVRPNHVRELKTDASARVVPLHAELERLLPSLPSEGQLFPELTVNTVTKRFAGLRKQLDLERPGLVFHSTRKWFVTQCERTGVPEHWTASLVGHKSARSENQLTYGIYSAGISDEQKRSIVDQIRLPG
jgi:integrase